MLAESGRCRARRLIGLLLLALRAPNPYSEVTVQAQLDRSQSKLPALECHGTSSPRVGIRLAFGVRR
jgi:hypothetical protein